jgi:hypothetical protein
MRSLSLYLDFKRFGVLPHSGGLYDQDPDVMRDFRLIDSKVAQHEADQNSKQ